MFAISGHRVYSSGSATNVHGFERLKAPLSDPARRCQHSVANGGLQQLNISVSVVCVYARKRWLPVGLLCFRFMVQIS